MAGLFPLRRRRGDGAVTGGAGTRRGRAFRRGRFEPRTAPLGSGISSF